VSVNKNVRIAERDLSGRACSSARVTSTRPPVPRSEGWSRRSRIHLLASALVPEPVDASWIRSPNNADSVVPRSAARCRAATKMSRGTDNVTLCRGSCRGAKRAHLRGALATATSQSIRDIVFLCTRAVWRALRVPWQSRCGERLGHPPFWLRRTGGAGRRCSEGARHIPGWHRAARWWRACLAVVRQDSLIGRIQNDAGPSAHCAPADSLDGQDAMDTFRLTRAAGRRYRHGIGHTPLCVRMGVDRPGAEIRLRFRCGEGGPGPGTGDGVRRPAERETGREVCGRQPARRRREEADHGSAPQRNDEQGRGHRDGDRVRHWRRRSQARPGDHAQGRPPAVTSGRWGTMPRRRPRGPVRPGAHWRRAWSAGAAPPSRRRTPPLCRIARPGLPRSSPARQGRGSTGRRRSCESPYPAPPNARPSAPRSSRSPAVGRTPVYCTAAAENSRTTIGTVGAPAAPPA